MGYKSCQNCGVVIDFDVPGLDQDEIFNHDQDKKCMAIKCPVCKEFIPSGEWEKVE